MFSQLLDGSAAANGLGWQWVAGTATGRPYLWSRRNVERRAPGLCATCELRMRCPIQRRAVPPEPQPLPEPKGLRMDLSPDVTAGPATIERTAAPEAVWLTAESLGDADPALAAHPELPALVVFDMPLLARWRLAGPRLVFLVETLGDLATRREVRVALGRPAAALVETRLAATFTPVPGWRHRRADLDVVETHPWPWLRRPTGGSARSFSAWRSSQGRSAG
jgi:deoxyribodipyrimidine photo-lyase